MLDFINTGFKKYFNSLSVKFIICTAAVTLISVLAAGLFPFYYLNGNINEEITHYNTQRLKYLKDTVDNRVFGKSLSILSELLVKNEVNDLIHNYLQNPEMLNYSRINSVMTMLKGKVAVNNDILSSVSIYYKKNGIIISSMGGIRYLSDTSKRLPYDDKWIELFEASKEDKNVIWLPSRLTPSYNSPEESEYEISLVSTFTRSVRSDESDALFCLSINEKSIRSIINEIVNDDEINVFIIDSSGCIISHNDPGKIGTEIKKPQMDSLLNSKEQSEGIIKIGDTETVVSSVKSDYCNWYYLMSAPSNLYFHKTLLARKVVILICTMVFLVLLIMGILISIKLTYPFSRIMSYIRNVLQMKENPGHKNELLFIDDALNMLSMKTNIQEQILNGNRELVKQTFFLNLLGGRKFSGEEMDSTLKFLGLKLDMQFFTAAIVQSNMFSNSAKAFDGIDCRIHRYVLSSKSDSMNIIPAKYDERHIALIFNHADNSGGEASDFVNKLNSFMEEELKTISQCGIGSVCENLDGIGVSCVDAHNALLYSSIHPEMRVFECSVTRKWDRNNSFDYRYTDSLAKSINEYRIDNCKQYMYIIMNSVIDGHVSYRAYKCIINEIIACIDKLALNNRIDLSEIFSIPTAEQIESQHYIVDVFKCIENILIKITDYIVSQHSSLNSVYVSRAKEFIDMYYYKDISIQDIADKLNISRHHLCRVFKETSSTTLLNYITEVRMNKAKELLGEGKLSIYDIASRVGFNSTTYFNKKFKQNFGTTPSQFKANE